MTDSDEDEMDVDANPSKSDKGMVATSDAFQGMIRFSIFIWRLFLILHFIFFLCRDQEKECK